MSTIGVNSFTRRVVRQRVEAMMLARIVISRGSLGTLDTTRGTVGGLTDGNTVYRGKARVRTVGNAGTISVGGGEIAIRRTIISIPIDSPIPHRDDLVQVLTDDEADRNLDTRIFRVMSVEGGSLFGDARRMEAVGWYESRYWGKQS